MEENKASFSHSGPEGIVSDRKKLAPKKNGLDHEVPFGCASLDK
jgi:hypothetical protein